MVVVLPVPLTPTTSTTWGRFAESGTRGRATGSRMAEICPARAARTASGATSLSKRVAASSAVSAAAVSTPRSAVISSSSSSSMAAPSSLRLVKMAPMPSPSFADERPSPALRRENSAA